MSICYLMTHTQLSSEAGSTVKASNIGHFLPPLDIIRKKQNRKKNSSHPNKVIIILYLHIVQNEKYFPKSLATLIRSAQPPILG